MDVEVTYADLVNIVGLKEVELTILRRRVKELESRLNLTVPHAEDDD